MCTWAIIAPCSWYEEELNTAVVVQLTDLVLLVVTRDQIFAWLVVGSMYNHAGSLHACTLPLKCAKVHYFYDQNLQMEMIQQMDLLHHCSLLSRCWSRKYFGIASKCGQQGYAWLENSSWFACLSCCFKEIGGAKFMSRHATIQQEVMHQERCKEVTVVVGTGSWSSPDCHAWH